MPSTIEKPDEVLEIIPKEIKKKRLKIFDWKKDWWVYLLVVAIIFSAWAYRHDIRQYQNVVIRFCDEFCEGAIIGLDVSSDSMCNYCPNINTVCQQEITQGLNISK